MLQTLVQDTWSAHQTVSRILTWKKFIDSEFQNCEAIWWADERLPLRNKNCTILWIIILYTCATIYTKIFNFYDLSLECEGPLLTGHIHPSLFGSQGLNDHVWLALTQVLFAYNKSIIFDIEDPKDEPYQSLSYLITSLAISN